MSDSVAIYLPLNSYISVRGFTNAAFPQSVAIVDENGGSHEMSGSGEQDTPMQNGSYGFTTPSTAKNPGGFQVTVTVQSQQGGQWVPSQVTSGKTSLAYYNLVLVVSEDGADTDWNDAVVQFSWWTTP
ncbi:fucose-binding lectin II [Porticoccus sp.]